MSGIELIGPSTPTYMVVVDGFLVPHVHAATRMDGLWTLVVDNRFATEWVDRAELGRWIPILANMGAVCSGFSAHGENSSPLNRFKCRVGMVSGDDMATMRRESIELVRDDETDSPE